MPRQTLRDGTNLLTVPRTQCQRNSSSRRRPRTAFKSMGWSSHQREFYASPRKYSRVSHRRLSRLWSSTDSRNRHTTSTSSSWNCSFSIPTWSRCRQLARPWLRTDLCAAHPVAEPLQQVAFPWLGSDRVPAPDTVISPSTASRWVYATEKSIFLQPTGIELSIRPLDFL